VEEQQDFIQDIKAQLSFLQKPQAVNLKKKRNLAGTELTPLDGNHYA